MSNERTKLDLKAAAREASQSCACLKVRQASRMITKTYEEALRPTGLKATQYTMLSAATLADGAVSLTDLAEALGMDRSTFSRNLGPLERQGLVELTDDGYGRARSVKLTEAGAKLYAQAVPLWQSAQRDLRTALGEEGWQAFHTQMSSAANYA
ncbi:MarR family winged helix-turn-helix transcriptional regulator [Pelagibius sp. Alg239-R121]|uniref:MarR family winged helix-turn-helix transcriptional regulator n=1 Tax=Pelagibius sp. Alg239-R121 TaxID=2993448 RepID=UPI0024A68EFE|nr:MarR family winged helix-turn-helix transcriptional regulator [Pelagibius sp. Alg239-R121]